MGSRRRAPKANVRFSLLDDHEMNTDNSVPSFGDHFPDYQEFVKSLAEEYRHGDFVNWNDIITRVIDFFTPETIEEMDAILPGWKTMSSYAEGQTLFHVVCVFIALLNTPEYKDANDEEKYLLEWCVLLHDIRKKPQKGDRDLFHAFLSAAEAARILPMVGFEVTGKYEGMLDEWLELVEGAYVVNKGEKVNDNEKLPEIIFGIDEIFGKKSPGANVVKSIMFHMSLDTIKEWPCAAPLTEEEIVKYLDPELLKLLGALMLADSDAWNLFSADKMIQYQEEIREALVDALQLMENKT